MANKRPIHTKRWPSARRHAKKIPWSRMAHKRDTLPGFITNGCDPSTASDASSLSKSCPARLTTGFVAGTCRGRLIIEVVPSLMVQARQDNVTVVGVDGEFWWSVETPSGDSCLDDNVTAWTVWSLVRYEGNSENEIAAEQRTYNPWDTGINAAADDESALGYIEGDFSAPRDRISWQRHQLWEATSYCTSDDTGGGEGQVDITLSGTAPCADVSATLVDGSGIISSTCDESGALSLTGTAVLRAGGSQAVVQSKASHMRIHSKRRVPLKGNQTMVLQVDFGDPFHDCTGGSAPDWQLSMFGYLRPRIELA